MKKIAFIALSLFSVIAVNAQDKASKNPLKEKPATEVKSGPPVYSSGKLKVQPEYPGGIVEFLKFVDSKIDRKNIEQGAKGNLKAYVSFIVERDGSLSEIKVLRDPGFGLGAEVIKAIKKSPKWKPGQLEGKDVRSTYNVPVVVIIE